jgi:MSHA biogenesis protein MshJ
MNERVLQYVERLDAMALRERVLIFAALALMLILIANSVFISPLRAQQRILVTEMAQQQKELETLQAQVERLVKGSADDPDAANRRREIALREELRQLNSRIVEEQRRFTPPQLMRGLLEEMLEKNRRLALVDLKTLPVAPIAGQRPGASGGMYRHGIELTLRGSYGELHDYLQTLEKLPNQLYWSRAELTVAKYPVLTLKLTVHTLSFDRAWLIV